MLISTGESLDLLRSLGTENFRRELEDPNNLIRVIPAEGEINE